ncbi:unnamed protein product [Ostreobium quekettii]|uniref:Uncharacterized protein n=1 Tax=Ostreobium quekettii TaxID=121088 RepID=A0A8S1JCH2_9CHLO|nr:unnamed protein product [Ostreobium quekettii]
MCTALAKPGYARATLPQLCAILLQMQDLREQFRTKEMELVAKQAVVEERKQELELELAGTQERLEEECFVNTALRKGEAALVVHCVGLTDDIHRWAQESEVLFSKLDRFATIDSTNRELACQLKQLLTDRLNSMSNNADQVLDSHKQRSVATAKCLKDFAAQRQEHAEGLKNKISELQSAEDNMGTTLGSTVRELHSVGNATAENMVNLASACAKNADAILKGGQQKCTEAHEQFDATVHKHSALLQQLAADQKKEVEKIVDTTRSSHSDVRVRLSGVKRSAAEIRATVEHSIDENRNALESLARRYQDSMAETGRELTQELSNRIGQLVSSFSATIKEAMDVTQDEVAAKQRKGMEACDVHCRGVIALGNQVQEHADRLEVEANTFFDGLPAAAAKVAEGINLCSESEQRLHASSRAALREGLTMINDRMASMKGMSEQAQGQANRVVAQAEDQTLTFEKQLSGLRGECEMQVEADLQAGQLCMSQADASIQAGHQLVLDFGALHSASAKDLIQGAAVVLEEKLQWDDGTPKLPERRQGEVLPSREFVHQLQAPPREVLCDACRGCKNDGGDDGGEGGPKFTMGQAPNRKAPTVPLKQSQGTAPSSPARSVSPNKEPPTKIPALGATRIPVRRPAAWPAQDQSEQGAAMADHKLRSKIPKLADPGYVIREPAGKDASRSDRADG